MPPSRLQSPPAPPFRRSTRDKRIAELETEQFDVLVIGGGITGVGVARDAAMRGLRTVLVERGDLGCGTSSASSKLVHGGLRYLEQGEVRLVFESVSERHRLRQLAPHLVRPIPFVFPVYKKKPKPLWMVETGLWIYDAMALFRSYKLHSRHKGNDAAELEPALRKKGLDGAVRYYDCMTDDARLTLETARGAHEAGAWILPYTEVKSFRMHRSEVVGADVVDLRTGTSHAISARVVVNATGPWADRTLGLRGDRPRMLRPTKGVHIVVHRDRLPVRNSVVLTSVEDHRVIFAIPWGNRVVIGTTDTDFNADFDSVHADRADIDYLLKIANYYFPASDLLPADVLGTWAGLRPLIAVDASDGPSQVSREHEIRVDDDGLITVAGGKLTTYRLMAAEVLDEVAKRLKAEGVHVGGCQTGSVLLPGGAGIAFRGEELVTLGPDGLEAERELEQRLGFDVAEHLQESYGGKWLEVVARTTEDEALAERIVEDLPYLWAEVDHAVEEEMTLTLRDFMRRRTQLEIRDFDASVVVAPAVAARMGVKLGWSDEDVRNQIAVYEREAGYSMAWRDEPASDAAVAGDDAGDDAGEAAPADSSPDDPPAVGSEAAS